jgi:hypothetical protein
MLKGGQGCVLTPWCAGAPALAPAIWTSEAAAHTRYAPFSTDLIAGQHTDIGDVKVCNDATTLAVTGRRRARPGQPGSTCAPIAASRRSARWWRIGRTSAGEEIETMSSQKLGFFCGVAAALGAAGALAQATAPVAEESAKDIVATTVRSLGHPCERPERAVRDEAASLPDQAAWILTCSNARYWVRYNNDEPAEIRRLE